MNPDVYKQFDKLVSKGAEGVMLRALIVHMTKEK